MSLLINLRHLEKDPVHLEGEITAAELDLADYDELIEFALSLKYNFEAELMEDAILVQGELKTTLKCTCARCLKTFKEPFTMEGWALHLPLAGEDKAIIKDDCVDLTPYLREDILLTLPQRPLCDTECSGLKTPLVKRKQLSGASETDEASSAWAELNKLKFKKE